MQRLTLLITVAVCVLCLVLVKAAVDFQRRIMLSETLRSASQAVVFTGQYDRIELALALMHSGQVRRLLISGVNQGAGLSPDRLVPLFERDAPWLGSAIAEGRVDLDETAQNTFDNARETACWYRREGLSGPLMLITSTAHMPRASAVLEAQLPGVEIQREHIASPRQTKPWRQEFPRYLVARLLLWSTMRPSHVCVENQET